MANLFSINRPSLSRVTGEVIFVHGIRGDAKRTWHQLDRPDLFWLNWLAKDIPDLRIDAVEYDADFTEWKGFAMRLEERATNLIDLFRANNLGTSPLLLVCHSYGGLVAKEIIRQLENAADDRSSRLFSMLRGVIFFATPHGGAGIVNYLKWLPRVLLRATAAVDEMSPANVELAKLNAWFQGYVAARRLKIRVFYETRATAGHRIVTSKSADPGVRNVEPIPIDADHDGICKPSSRRDQVYISSLQFIQDILDNEKESQARHTARTIEKLGDLERLKLHLYPEEFDVERKKIIEEWRLDLNMISK